MKKTKKRIAIMGAGPAGATLGAILQKHGVPFEIFEREPDSTVRDQGGSLDMKDDSGQIALKAAGAYDDFLRLSRPEGQEFRLLNPQGETVFADAAEDDEQYNPEIDRGPLRQILLDKIPSDRIHWGYATQHVTSHADGTHTVAFTNGRKETFDLVIGADGAWSKIRPALSNEEPVYSGVTFFEFALQNADQDFPEISALVGPGKMFAAGINRTYIGQRNDHSSIRLYLALRVPLSWATEHRDMRAALKKEFQEFAPVFLSMIDRYEGAIIPRPIYALPVPHRWTPKKGLTLVGDAAHLMSPFSGMGANLAMQDAADLALAIVEHDDLEQAVAHYEAIMFPRGIECAKGSAEGIDGAVSDHALQDILQQFQEIVAMKATGR